jgi:hypothetical protein
MFEKASRKGTKSLTGNQTTNGLVQEWNLIAIERYEKFH